MAGTYLPGRSGAEAEAVVLQRLLSQRYDVAIPFGNTPYDLIVDTGHVLSRLQVRRAYFADRKGCFVVDLRLPRRDALRNYDYLVAVAGVTCYVRSVELIQALQTLTLRPEACSVRRPSGRRGMVSDLETYRERWDILTKERV